MNMSPTHLLIAEGLLNGLWQGLALAAIAWAALKLLRPPSAGTRYAAWWMVLAAMVALPVVQISARLWPRAPEPNPMPAVAFDWTSVAESVNPVVSAPVTEPLFQIEVPTGWLVWLLGIWIAVSAGLLVRLAISYLYLVRMKREAQPPAPPIDQWEASWHRDLEFGRTPELRVSPDARMPLTAGLVRPALLFPVKLFRSLHEREAREIWLHETAHMRRWDDWTKLGQKLSEALLWFHPAVGAIGRRLSLERELACDEWVVARTGSPKTYAACLSKLAEMAVHGSLASPALGMAENRKQIVRRVEMLLNQSRSPRKRASKISVLVLASVIGVAFLALACAKPAVVMAQADPPPPPTVVPAPPPPPATARVAVPEPKSPPTPPTPTVTEPAPVVAPALAPAPVAQPDPAPEVEVLPELEEHMAAIQEQLAPLREQLSGLEQQMQPLHEAMSKIQEQMRPLQERMQQIISSELRPLQEDMQRALRDSAEARSRALEQLQNQNFHSLREALERARQESMEANERLLREDQSAREQDLQRVREEMLKARQELQQAWEAAQREMEQAREAEQRALEAEQGAAEGDQ